MTSAGGVGTQEVNGVIGSSRIIWLLAVASFINYVDRGNLATAAPLLQGELSLTNTQLGLLMSAFFWTYIPGQFPAGWLTERLGTRYVLGAAVALWGLATALTGLVHSFALLLVLRVLLGIGESALYPATCVVLAQQLPDNRRGAANGAVASSLMFGPSFGVLLGGLVMAAIGWRPVFVAFGVLTLLWLWPWLRTDQQGPGSDKKELEDAPSLKALLRQRNFWGTCVGHFALAYALYQVMSWLPLYLVRVHGMSVATMAKFGGLCYLMAGLASIAAGQVADSMTRRGARETLVRKVTLAGGLLGVAACMVGLSWAGATGALVAMIACSMCLGIILSAYSAVVQVMAGAQVAGRWMGLASGLANIAGVIGPIITGALVDRTGSFTASFLIAAVVASLGALGYAVIMGRVEPIRWTRTSG